MSDTKRVIIGSEINDSRHLELDFFSATNQVTIPVTEYDGGGKRVNLGYDLITLTYDGSQNNTKVVYSLAGLPVDTYALSYDGNNNVISIARS